MVKLSDLLVDKSLHRPAWHHSVASLIFFTSYGIEMLTIDGVTSVLPILDVQNERKNTHFSPNESWGKFWQSVQDGGIVIDYEGFVHIFNLFVC